MPERNSGLYFNASMLVLLLTLMGMFVIWMPWTDCRPLANFDPKNYPDASVPADAECFYINHGTVHFLSESGQWRRTAIFLALDAFVLFPGCILFIRYAPELGRRLFRRNGQRK